MRPAAQVQTRRLQLSALLDIALRAVGFSPRGLTEGERHRTLVTGGA